MGVVVQNDKKGARRVRVAAGAGLAALTVAAIVTGCSTGASSGVRPAAGQEPLKAPPARALQGYADRLAAEQTARKAAAQRWGLARTPLAPPPPPARKPKITARAGFQVDGQVEDDLPPVFTRIPTDQRVVFLTVDDGTDKDPAFLRMMSDLRVPYSAFLTDDEAGDDYAYFRRLQREGNTVNNHTLHHPYLPGLSYAEQRHEICGMQDIMEREFGTRPVLFRPPYGNYNRDTLVAAKSCGIKYAPIWDEEVFVDHWEYREDDQRLHPGDIVLTHFRGRAEWNGTMVDDMHLFLDKVTREGYAVARLEDYL